MNPPLFREQGEFYRNLFAISVPIMIQNFVSAVAAMISTMMIGRMGTVEIAAVGLGNQIFQLLNMTVFGIGSGGTIFVAQFWGKKDIGGIRKNLGLCLTLNLGTALLFTLGAVLIPDKLISIYTNDPLVIKAGADFLRYLSPGFIPFAIAMVYMLTLRSVERVRLTVIATTFALVVNILLNFPLIFGMGPFPGMGVRGAAIATAASRYAEMAILIIGSYMFGYAPAARLGELFAFNSAYVGRYLRLCIPVIINESVWQLGVTIQNLILARSSTEAIAAFNITGTISGLTWVVFAGLAHGVAVLIGKKIGEGREKDAREYAFRINVFSPIMALGVICILIPLSRALLSFFNISEATLLTSSLMIIVLSATYPLKAFNMTMIIGTCRAGGDTVFCAIYDLAPLWFISLPLGAAAAFIFRVPAHIIYLFLLMEEPVKAVMGIWRLKTGKWLHNVTIGS
ncbi:MAG: MATE family efflux transporter [Treponema sp.]|nr:MATE family efflux transporter [Treponema sp.]